MGSLHQIQHKQIRKMPTSCCQIWEWRLLKKKQCYIYAKGTKMANFITKKNEHKNGNDVQDSPPPYCHTIANVPYSCNHQNNKRPWSNISITILQNTEPHIWTWRSFRVKRKTGAVAHSSKRVNKCECAINICHSWSVLITLHNHT
jgi:hypothetical protein